MAAVRAPDGLTGTIRSPVQSSVVRVAMGYEADIEQCVCVGFFAGAATAKHPVPGPCSRGTAFVAVLRVGEPGTEVSAELVPCEASLLGLSRPLFSLCPGLHPGGLVF